MTCEEFGRVLCALGTDPPGLDLRAHAGDCAACRLLLQLDHDLRGSASPAGLPQPLPGALRQLLAAQTDAVRSPSGWTRAFAVLSAGVAGVAVTLACAPRADLQAGMSVSTWIGFGVLGSAFLASLWVHARRGALGLGTAPAARWLMAAAGFLGFQVFARSYAVAWFGSATPGLHVPLHDCLVYGLAVASLVGAVLFALYRGSVILSEHAAGASAGCVAGLAAVLALHTHCPAVDATHLQIVHALPLVLAIVIGAAVGRRALAP